MKEHRNYLGWSSTSLHTDYMELCHVLDQCQPDAIVHLAEMPSAPWSMMNRGNCIETHNANMVGTLNLLFAMREKCPSAHLLKLGTMGEYGTPNVDIPEGMFELEFRGRKDKVMFPRKAGSWYHLTKVHDTHNIEFACRNWGMRSTDIMQGVVFGVRTPTLPDESEYLTRFDYDECFGTAVNRFCAQAIVERSITVYGKGGQTRGWIPLQDSVRCMRLAIESPPDLGEYRVFNQFATQWSVNELGAVVQSVSNEMGLTPFVANIDNPRNEMEEHYYNPDCNGLRSIGYEPSTDMETLVGDLIADLIPFKDRIIKEKLLPKIQWR